MACGTKTIDGTARLSRIVDRLTSAIKYDNIQIIVAKTHKPKSDALKYLHDRYVGDNPRRLAALEAERVNLDIACKIYDLRTRAGLSQRELAKRIGTSAANICRLENADYQGHSLPMLRRIATALEMRVEVRFLPIAHR
jgi:ribosome-binding protein aMBF1 (putative translation factor)